MLAHACDPSVGEVVTGGPLGFADKLATPKWRLTLAYYIPGIYLAWIKNTDLEQSLIS